MQSRKFAFFVLALVAGEYVIFLSLLPPRPSVEERVDEELPGGPYANLFGQSGYWQLGYASALTLLIYAVKTTLVFRFPNALSAIYYYSTFLASCPPFLWAFVTRDWNNAHALLGFWFTLPIGLLLVPAIGFVADLGMRPYSNLWGFAVKTIIELLLIPVWFCVWLMIEVMIGFYWI